jgi:UrcA family protein
MKYSALVLLGIVAATPAVAGGPKPIVVNSDVPTARVHVTRADFASPQTRRLLNLRIGIAIESVCGSYSAIETSQTYMLDDCWDDARAQVARQLPLVGKSDTTIALVGR